jgi:dTDP-4-dehydrorhamnose 3,5-epimerase
LFESFNSRHFEQVAGSGITFVQDNQSSSRRGVIRGFHYQVAPKIQGKLVRVVQGEIFDVAVDLRRDSPFFGKWVGCVLSASNRKQMWVPGGFAHGFQALSPTADVLYKITDYWSPDCERSIRFDDRVLGVDWPMPTVAVSARDRAARSFAEADYF